MILLKRAFKNYSACEGIWVSQMLSSQFHDHEFGLSQLIPRTKCSVTQGPAFLSKVNESVCISILFSHVNSIRCFLSKQYILILSG